MYTKCTITCQGKACTRLYDKSSSILAIGGIDLKKKICYKEQRFDVMNYIFKRRKSYAWQFSLWEQKDNNSTWPKIKSFMHYISTGIITWHFQLCAIILFDWYSNEHIH